MKRVTAMGASFLKIATLLFLVAVCAQMLTARVHAAAPLVVSPQGPYTTIDAALRDAVNGDVIQVRGGSYRGNLVIAKTIVLEGVDQPILDAEKRGTVVTINAPDVTVRGFEIRNSGSEPDQDHAGIMANAPRVVIENNRLTQVLFGVFLAQAPDSIVRGNDITSQDEYDSGRKGDAVRLWYSPRVVIEKNRVHYARDVVIWYSHDVRIVNNVIEHGRYGVHLMYCDNAVISANRIIENSVGIYSMYSKNVVLRENDVRGQRGPSGYALGFKDTDDVIAANNLLVDNRGGIFLDGTPFNPTAFARFENNSFAFNDIAVTLMPAVKRAEFSNNAFWENMEQMAVYGGGGKADANEWRGNFWSDYSGLDADGDGVGDTPYVAEKFFEDMLDREPMLRALLYSPAAQTIEFAAASFPIIKPQPKLRDPAPRLTPPSLPAFAQMENNTRAEMFAIAFVLLGGAFLLNRLAHTRRGMIMDKKIFRFDNPQNTDLLNSRNESSPLAVRATNVGKTYHHTRVVDNVSFEVRAGEGFALWGPNGAGKTTLAKAMLGLIPFQGSIELFGCAVKQHGKRARAVVGYVPQEVTFYDWTTRATMEFYARLKRVAPSRIDALLTQMGLAAHASKQVSALSGGLKQRLALALALLSDPPLLLLDEPTANLDSQARAEYVRLIAELKGAGKTIVFASHRLEEVETLADTVLWLANDQPARVMPLETWRAETAPAVELTLWFANHERERANEFLNANGWNAHLNGRGTVVVRTRAQEKLRALQLLNEQGFVVDDFEIERAV